MANLEQLFIPNNHLSGTWWWWVLDAFIWLLSLSAFDCELKLSQNVKDKEGFCLLLLVIIIITIGVMLDENVLCHPVFIL